MGRVRSAEPRLWPDRPPFPQGHVRRPPPGSCPPPRGAAPAAAPSAAVPQRWIRRSAAAPSGSAGEGAQLGTLGAAAGSSALAPARCHCRVPNRRAPPAPFRGSGCGLRSSGPGRAAGAQRSSAPQPPRGGGVRCGCLTLELPFPCEPCPPALPRPDGEGIGLKWVASRWWLFPVRLIIICWDRKSRCLLKGFRQCRSPQPPLPSAQRAFCSFLPTPVVRDQTATSLAWEKLGLEPRAWL